jgi:hypothetical protein
VTALFEGVGIALESLRAHKARAALTILGVAIGVMVVMVIGALISGFNKSLTDSLESLGPRTFSASGAATTRSRIPTIPIPGASGRRSPWRRPSASSNSPRSHS